MYTWEELVLLMNALQPGATLPDGFWERIHERREKYERNKGKRFNVAPTQSVPILRTDAAGMLEPAILRWGLIPSWSRDEAIGARCINARSEDAGSKPAFRAAAKHRRCLVPMSSFYEWEPLEGQKFKQPWSIRVAHTNIFAVAGLWEGWEHGPEPIETFTILTCEPNELMARFHARMPVIVSPEMYRVWMDPARENYADLGEVLKPFAAEKMEAHRVSTRVNSVANDDAGLLDPVGPRSRGRCLG